MKILFCTTLIATLFARKTPSDDIWRRSYTEIIMMKQAYDKLHLKKESQGNLFKKMHMDPLQMNSKHLVLFLMENLILKNLINLKTKLIILKNQIIYETLLVLLNYLMILLPILLSILLSILLVAIPVPVEKNSILLLLIDKIGEIKNLENP